MNLNEGEYRKDQTNMLPSDSTSKLPCLKYTKLSEVNSMTRAKSYGMGLESKNYWIEKEQGPQSSINRSSVRYNILSHGKNQTSGKLEGISNLREHKKESVSKFADLQNTYHHRQCELHRVS